MQIKSDRIVFPDNTEQFTAGGGSGGGSVETVDAPAFSASLSAPASMSNTGWTKVPFSVVEYDTENSFDTTNNRFNPSVAGYYKLTFNARFNGNVKSCFGAVYLNGAEKFSTYNASEKLSTTLLVEGTVYLNGTTDYVEAFVFHGSDTPLDLSNSLSHTYFQGVLVKPANSGTLVGGEPVTLDALGIPNHDKVTVETDDTTSYNVMNFPNDTVTTAIQVGSANDKLVLKNGNAERLTIAPDGIVNIVNHLGVGRDPTNYKNFAIETRPSAVGATHGLNVELNDAGFIASCSRTDRTAMSGLRSVDGWGTIGLHVNSADRFTISDTRCDIAVPLYVQGNPKSIDVVLSDMETKLADRDKLIDKLMARIETLEKKVK